MPRSYQTKKQHGVCLWDKRPIVVRPRRYEGGGVCTCASPSSTTAAGRWVCTASMRCSGDREGRHRRRSCSRLLAQPGTAQGQGVHAGMVSPRLMFRVVPPPPFAGSIQFEVLPADAR